MKRKSIRRLGVILAASTLVAQMSMAGVTAVSATEQPIEVTEQQLSTFAEGSDKLVSELDDALADQGNIAESETGSDNSGDLSEIDEEVDQPEAEKPSEEILGEETVGHL